MAQIEPVPAERQLEAACFMIAGRGSDPALDIQARNLINKFNSGNRNSSRFWWAHDQGRCLAVAMVFVGEGKVGFLLHSSADWPDVDKSASRDLISKISLDALQGDISMVQSLIYVPSNSDEGLLREAGMEFLVELIYMSLDVRRPVASISEPAGLSWKHHGQWGFKDEKFGKIIKETYLDTLDCPRLPGVREIDDILASHKASGLFTPQCWLMVEWDEKPAGVVLINDTAIGPSAEVAYLGVVPEFRGKGLGKILLARAIAQARERKRDRLLLAVDTRNSYALNIYLATGFMPTGRKKAYALFKK